MPVLLTGLSATTAIGDDPDAILDALLQGQVGLAPLRHPDVARMRSTVGYEIDHAPEANRFMRPSRWVTSVVRRALADAGIEKVDPRNTAVVIGTSQRELNAVEMWAAGRGRAVRGDELSYRRAITQAVGPVRVYSLLGACAAGILAVGIAVDLLEEGEADLVIAVSVESTHATVQAMYDRVSPRIADVIRPFDAHRQGTIFGEGAAAVVLERAGERTATPRAVIKGVGFSSDAQRSTNPDVAGVHSAVVDAYRRADVTGQDVDVVLTHGTGTTSNDDAEAEALTRLGCTRAFVTALKPMIGHTLGSSGLISLVTAAGCLARGVVPPVLNLKERASMAAHLNLTTASVMEASLQIAQVNAFGFGGINAVAILEKVA